MIVLYITGFCVGLCLAMESGMILYWMNSLLERLPKWVSKPLGECPTCMAGPYGTIIYWYLNQGISYENVFWWIVTLFCASTLNTLVYNLIQFLQANKLERDLC